MTHTDDIPENVARILIEQASKYINLASDTTIRSVQGVSAVTTRYMSELYDKLKNDVDMRKYLQIEGEIPFTKMQQVVSKFGDQSSTVSIANSDAQEYESFLNAQGVMYAKIDHKNDDSTMYVFLNKDKQKVRDASIVLDSRRGRITEVQPSLYFNSIAPDKVYAVEGLSNIEMELFRHYAREEQLLFTTITKDDKYMLVCDHADSQNVRRALLRTGWALTGANGARVKEQVQYRLAGRSSIRIAAEDAAKELYIVSGINPKNYVRISHSDYTFYKENEPVKTVSRDDPDFFQKCIAECDGLVHPVVLTPEQKHKITPQELAEATTTDLFPSNYDDYIQIQQLNSFVNLVAMKEGIDDEHDATWGLWDPSVSYSEFAAYEYIQDDEEREAREYEFEHFRSAAYYSKNHLTEHSIEMDQKNVDYIIAQADAKRKSMLNASQKREIPEKVPSKQSTPPDKEHQLF